MEQRLWSRSREIVPLLRPQARLPSERIQSCLRKQRRERQVREQCYTHSIHIFHIFGRLTISSLRLWEALGFTRAGLIPNAGRLKKEGGGEEYVDAIVFYKSFVDDDQQ